MKELLDCMRLREIMFRRVWESAIMDTLDRRPNKKVDYVLLRSEQVATNVLQHWNMRFDLFL